MLAEPSHTSGTVHQLMFTLSKSFPALEFLVLRALPLCAWYYIQAPNNEAVNGRFGIQAPSVCRTWKGGLRLMNMRHDVA